ncbi:hypothetical protein NE237_023501 [Protea cynaroides]|uniref:Uncharacterized protein n=1 Tax=Protea cynaroides TaxID=273540 RepID=A0A9Q0HBU7_9MAGN|nr:hypothetical protein NE237_023501 [Protea cynaroides]
MECSKTAKLRGSKNSVLSVCRPSTSTATETVSTSNSSQCAVSRIRDTTDYGMRKWKLPCSHRLKVRLMPNAGRPKRHVDLVEPIARGWFAQADVVEKEIAAKEGAAGVTTTSSPNSNDDRWSNKPVGFPKELGQLQNIVALILNNNNIHGGITVQLTNCSSLVTLNLSYNNLSGVVPCTKNISRFPPEWRAISLTESFLNLAQFSNNCLSCFAISPTLFQQSALLNNRLDFARPLFSRGTLSIFIHCSPYGHDVHTFEEIMRITEKHFGLYWCLFWFPFVDWTLQDPYSVGAHCQSSYTVSFFRHLRLPWSMPSKDMGGLLQEVWRIDKDEFTTSFAIMRVNLMHLFVQSAKAYCLRRIIVDLEV